MMKILSQRTRGVWLLLFAFALYTQAFAETVTNTYDTLNRLTSVVYGNGQQITYTYDPAGNRTAMSGNTLIAPNAFTFIPQPNVALNTQIASNTITVSGVNAAPPITIAGGEYSINGGPYTTAPGNVSNGDTVTVRLTSAAIGGATTSATLTIGGVSGTFTATTIPPAPAVSLSPTALTFVSQGVGSTSAAQTVTLTNSGGALLNITSIVASGDFASTTCGATLAAGASCAINVTFTPTAVATLSGAVTITSDAAGSPHSMNLTGTGAGANASRGAIFAGAGYTIARQIDGGFVGWGVLGSVSVNTPVILPIPSQSKDVANGFDTAQQSKIFYVKPDGTVWGSAGLYSGPAAVPAPETQVLGLTNITSISAAGGSIASPSPYLSSSNLLAVDAAGAVWWFNGGAAVQVSGLTGVTKALARSWHVVARKSDGTVWSLGNNMYYQVGHASSSAPQQVPGLISVVDIAATSSCTLALKDDGTVWGWGYCGNGFWSTVTQVSGLSNITALAASEGGAHFLALKSDGTVWAWGFNSNGQIGNGTTANQPMPVQVPGLPGITQVAAGNAHSVALAADGTIWAWGSGDGATANRLTPAQVAGVNGLGYLNLNAFNFTPQVNVQPGSVVTSNPVTVAGVTAPAPISITGGQYRINNGAYTSVAGTVSNGDAVTIQLTAATAGGSAQAVLTIGGINSIFAAKTVPFVFTDSVTGYVRDSSGAGVPNISVRAYTGKGWIGGETVADTVTQPDGRYIIPLPKGAYSVSMSTTTSSCGNPAHPPAYATSVNNVSVNGQQVLDFTVPQLVTLSGRVTDANNIGAGGVTLGLQKSGTDMMWYLCYNQSVQTGADGSYSIQVYPGSYNISITNWNDTYVAAAGVNIAANTTRNFVLNATPSAVSGFVRDSANQGVAGVMVRVSANASTGPDGQYGSTMTLPDGSYHLPLMQDGAYTVGIMKGMSCVQQPCSGTYAKADRVTVTGNSVHNFVLPPMVTLYGMVTNGGVGVPNAAVNIYAPFDAYGGAGGNTRTAANGSYSLSVYVGSYNINVSPTATAGNNPSYMAAAGLNVATNTLWNFALDAAPSSISGFVRDASGAGVSGIAINASSGPAGMYGSTATAPDGSYRISLPPGTYTLQVGNIYCSTNCVPPMYSAWLNNVSVNGAVTHDFVVPPIVTLSGRVADVNGAPVAGIGVNAVSRAYHSLVMPSTPGTPVYTDLNGNYSIQVYAGFYDIDVAVGDINIGGTGTRYTAAANVDISANTTRDLALFNIYTPQNRISGRFSNSGAGWAFAIVDLTGSGIATAYADWMGDYSFINLADGAYTLTPSLRGYSFAPATRSITISGTSMSGADFQVCRDGSALTGVVLDTATRIALPSGTILVDGVSYTADATGHYSIPGLSCGAHNVAVNVPGYVSYNTALDTFNSWDLEIGLTKMVVLVPNAPTIGTAVAGNTQAIVNFAAPANNGGSVITGYTVKSTPGNITAIGAASPIVVTGLTNGIAYSFTVAATNSAGSSLLSAVSNAVTPAPPVAIFTASATAGANGSITPASQAVAQGNTANFTVTPNAGYTASASGCGGALTGSTYTTGAITANCTVSATFTQNVIPMNLVIGWNLLGNSVNAPLTVAATFGNAANVSTVWKWIPATSKWAFYTPSLADGGAAYATTKGYDFLTAINGGEGFWVNAKAAFTAQLPAGAAINTSYFQDQFAPAQNKLVKGWNLIATGDNVTPSVFNAGLSMTPPAQGVIPLNVTTLWAWDNGLASWYFYAPSLEASNGLANYITTKGYLNFGAKTLDPAMGFWVNKP